VKLKLANSPGKLEYLEAYAIMREVFLGFRAARDGDGYLKMSIDFARGRSLAKSRTHADIKSSAARIQPDSIGVN
jgi:hypothetical protein